MGGGGFGGGGEVQKNDSRKGKLNEKKIHAHQLTLILMLRPKKKSYNEFDNEVNSCSSKIPHHPHNFSNGPSPNLWCGQYNLRFPLPLT